MRLDLSWSVGRGVHTYRWTKISIRKVDLMVTLAWTWHEHGKEGKSDTIWLEGLDLIFVY